MNTGAPKLRPDRAKRGDKWQELAPPVVLSLLTEMNPPTPERIQIVGGGCDCSVRLCAITGNERRIHA